MGNCLTNAAAGGGPSGGDGWPVQLPLGRARRRGGDEEEQEEKESSSVLKVKMMLTKAELEWLMAQLKVDGGRRLEEVLREMARKRDGRAGGWRPSLESIVECPETASAATVAAAGIDSD